MLQSKTANAFSTCGNRFGKRSLPKKESRHCRAIDTFLRGYYGEAAAPHVLRYLEIMHESAHNHSYHMVSCLDAESRRSDCH